MGIIRITQARRIIFPLDPPFINRFRFEPLIFLRIIPIIILATWLSVFMRYLCVWAFVPPDTSVVGGAGAGHLVLGSGGFLLCCGQVTLLCWGLALRMVTMVLFRRLRISFTSLLFFVMPLIFFFSLCSISCLRDQLDLGQEAASHSCHQRQTLDTNILLHQRTCN